MEMAKQCCRGLELGWARPKLDSPVQGGSRAEPIFLVGPERAKVKAHQESFFTSFFGQEKAILPKAVP